MNFEIYLKDESIFYYADCFLSFNDGFVIIRYDKFYDRILLADVKKIIFK